MTDFSSLGLSEPLLHAVSELGYSKASPIQAKAIPMVLTGRDIMASAQTGTGKTAGYTLPLLQRLSEMKVLKNHPVRALILVPTRELAIQVSESVVRYGKHLSLTSTVVYGGVDMEPQINALNAGADILVATPGRLLDLLSKQHLTLSHLKILVLDEADRMLDLGFKPDIERILSDVPVKRQNLLFSATFSKEIKQLAHDFQRHPVKIEIENPNSAANTVKQSVYPVDQQDKPEILSYIIEGGKWDQVLVFVRTKKAADKVADLLFHEGISATSIHSDKSQHARSRTLVEFQAGAYRVLVATDVAARGLDIDQLPLVVNYDLPRVPQDYVHRIGRTGRAGAPGRAISLMNPEEKKLLENIRKLIKKPLNVEPVPYFDDMPATLYEKQEEESAKKKSAINTATKSPFTKKPYAKNGSVKQQRSNNKPVRSKAGQSSGKPSGKPAARKGKSSVRSEPRTGAPRKGRR